jgi:hypothetical protein
MTTTTWQLLPLLSHPLVIVHLFLVLDQPHDCSTFQHLPPPPPQRQQEKQSKQEDQQLLENHERETCNSLATHEPHCQLLAAGQGVAAGQEKTPRGVRELLLRLLLLRLLYQECLQATRHRIRLKPSSIIIGMQASVDHQSLNQPTITVICLSGLPATLFHHSYITLPDHM